MTIVPRTGPLSASSALLRTSWYQRGKSSARGVRTGGRGMTRGYRRPLPTFWELTRPRRRGAGRSELAADFRPAHWYFGENPSNFLRYGDRRARAALPAPRPRDRGGDHQVRRRCPALD